MNKNEGLYIQDLYYDSTSAPYGCLALPWWIREKKPVYWPRHNCLLEPLICGERVFSKLKDDIENAKHSVNIITWGFDPGMHLVRGKYGDGVKYGDLLKSVATRKPPVKVNLLVWHDDLLSQSKMKNIPGYYGAGHPAVGCYQKKEFYYQEHQEYNAQWFDDVNRNRSGEIEFRYRFVSFEFLKPSLAGEGMPIDIMKIASASYATHHQKMVLIDYEDPPNAIGYVMGHNSITDFWDTEEHIFQDVRRERFFNQEASKIVQEALKRESTARLREGNFSSASSPSMEKSSAFAKYINDHSYVAKPYQDVSCRVRGPILSDMNHNFCEAWMEGSRPGAMFFELLGVTMRPVINTATRRALGKATYYKDKEDWIENRKVLTWKSFVSPQWTHSAQLLRTQPEQGEKSIK
jgi:phosphatidylserine/phosphatidylglycerophosphate/cardiolipin synthase-like enzyme